MSFPLFRSRPVPEKAPNPALAVDPKPEKRRSAYLTPDCKLRGKLCFFRDARVDGQVEGDVESAKSLTIGVHGEVNGDIESDSVVIAGRVEGNVVAKRQIRLAGTAYIVGDLETSGIVIEEGAQVEGKIVIRPKATEGSERPRRLLAQSMAPEAAAHAAC